MGFIRVDSAFAKRRGEISRIILGSTGWVNWSLTWCKYIYIIYISCLNLDTLSTVCIAQYVIQLTRHYFGSSGWKKTASLKP